MKLIIAALLLLLPYFSFCQKETDKKPFVIGETISIPSKILEESRILNIYLPEGYNSNDTTTYPVIYLLDGAADEDFIHISGLVQFSSFDWVGYLPPSIVVGIANVDRKKDFTFPSSVASERTQYPTSGVSDKFIQFIKGELQPYIGSHYRTQGSTTVIGQSLGGLLAAEILLKHPPTFEKYIIVSPSLWWSNGALVKASTAELESIKTPVKVYLAVGKEGLTPSENPRVMEVDVNLLAERLKAIKNPAFDFHFDYLPDENHATILHQAVMNAFKWLGKNNRGR